MHCSYCRYWHLTVPIWTGGRHFRLVTVSFLHICIILKYFFLRISKMLVLLTVSAALAPPADFSCRINNFLRVPESFLWMTIRLWNFSVRSADFYKKHYCFWIFPIKRARNFTFKIISSFSIFNLISYYTL